MVRFQGLFWGVFLNIICLFIYLHICFLSELVKDCVCSLYAYVVLSRCHKLTAGVADDQGLSQPWMTALVIVSGLLISEVLAAFPSLAWPLHRLVKEGY